MERLGLVAAKQHHHNKHKHVIGESSHSFFFFHSAIHVYISGPALAGSSGSLCIRLPLSVAVLPKVTRRYHPCDQNYWSNIACCCVRDVLVYSRHPSIRPSYNFPFFLCIALSLVRALFFSQSFSPFSSSHTLHTSHFAILSHFVSV